MHDNLASTRTHAHREELKRYLQGRTGCATDDSTHHKLLLSLAIHDVSHYIREQIEGSPTAAVAS